MILSVEQEIAIQLAIWILGYLLGRLGAWRYYRRGHEVVTILLVADFLSGFLFPIAMWGTKHGDWGIGLGFVCGLVNYGIVTFTSFWCWKPPHRS